MRAISSEVERHPHKFDTNHQIGDLRNKYERPTDGREVSIEEEKLKERIITFKELGLGFEEVVRLMHGLKGACSVS